MNIVVLRGTLAKEPEVRELATGSVVVSFEVSTPTPTGIANVPVAWLDPPGNVVLTPGDEVVLAGQVRRRFFRTAGSTQSRTEVIAARVVLASNRRGASALLRQAAASLDGP